MVEKRRRTTAIATRLLLVLLVGPLVFLGGQYGFGVATGIEFGNVVFALTIGTALGWMLSTTSRASGMRTAATTRTGSLLGLDTQYAKALSDGPRLFHSDQGIVLLAMTATVVLGWVIVVLPVR